MVATGNGLTLDGDEVTRVSAWVVELAGRVDISSHIGFSDSGSAAVDAAINNAEVWRRGAGAVVIADIADWGTDLGEAATVLATVDDAQAAVVAEAAYQAQLHRVV